MDKVYEVYNGPQFHAEFFSKETAIEIARQVSQRSLCVVSVREYLNGRFNRVVRQFWSIES